MRTDSFNHHNGTVTAREQTGADEAEQPFIAHLIADHVLPGVDIMTVPNRVYLRFLLFASIVQQQVEIKGDIGIAVPGPYAADADLIVFHDALFNDPQQKDLLRKWTDLLNRLNKPPAQALHLKPTDPEQSSDVDQHSETSDGQPTVA